MTYFSEVKIVDGYGNKVEATLLDQLKVTESRRVAGGVFNSTTLDSNYFTSTVGANGTATVTGSVLAVTTTTDSGSNAAVTTSSLARHVSGNSYYFRSAVIIEDVGAANNVRFWGAATGVVPTDGYWFRLSGTTFSIVTMNSSNPTVVSSGSFNGASTTYALDTNYHTYEIYYTTSKVLFVIDGVLIHTVRATTASIVGIRHLKPTISNVNTGVGSAVTISSMFLTINKLGVENSQAKFLHVNGANAGVLLKRGPGNLRDVLVNASANGSTVSIYDALSATNAIALLSFATAADAVAMRYDVLFNIGLYLVTTNAATDVTIIYE